jgi:chemotaxis protein MotB
MPGMASGRRGRARRNELDYWPGFVDALSTMLLAIIFLISVFMLGQFFLARELSSGTTCSTGSTARSRSSPTSSPSSAPGGRTGADRHGPAIDHPGRGGRARAPAGDHRLRERGAGPGRRAQRGPRQRAQATGRALNQVDLLTQQIAAIRRQLAALEDALAASESRDRESQSRIADLGSRLNVALAQRVQELAATARTSSGACARSWGPAATSASSATASSSLGALLRPGQAVVRPEGAGELDRIATLLQELERQIPNDIPWVLRVDGHTDQRPIATAQFPNNWALSASRAIAVVQYLISRGVPPQRLVAAGFGEFQPLDPAPTDEAYARNRRIELKLTER